MTSSQAPAEPWSLRDFGIRVDAPVGDIESDGTWTKIGSIILRDSGPICIVPRREVTEELRAILVQFAFRVRGVGRAATRGWRYVDGLGWVVGVATRLPRTEGDGPGQSLG